jgi:hypothetical protein
LLGFILGSAAAITFGLLGVVVVFLVLGGEYPVLQGEFPFLVASLGAFAGLTVLAGLSFYAQLQTRAWRRLAVGMLLLALAAAGWFYWPR